MHKRAIEIKERLLGKEVTMLLHGLYNAAAVARGCYQRRYHFDVFSRIMRWHYLWVI